MADRTLTFESNVLSGTSDSFDSVSGANIAVNTTAALVGTYGVDIPNLSNENGTITYTATDTVYVAAHIKVRTLPAGVRRIIQIKDTGGSTICGLIVSFTGANVIIRIQDGTTSTGSTQTLATGVGDHIQVALRYTKGTGANGIVEGYYTPFGSDWGAAFASTTTSTKTVQTDRVTVGNTTASALDMALDAINVSTTGLPSNLTISALTRNDYGESWASLTATYTGTGAITFQSSTDGSTWTDGVEPVASGVGYISGLTPNTATYLRARNATSTSFAYVGGGASPGTATTTLARKSFAVSPQNAGARNALFNTEPTNSTDDDSSTWNADWWNMQLPTDSAGAWPTPASSVRLTFIRAVRTRLGDTQTMLQYCLFNEVNSTDATTGKRNVNSWLWDDTAVTDFNTNIVPSGALLTSGGVTIEDGKLYLDPANTTWRAFQRKQMLRMMDAAHSNAIGNHERFSGFFFDNTSARPTKVTDTYTTGSGTANATWRAAVGAQLDYLMQVGAFITCNIIHARWDSPNYEIEDVSQHVNGMLREGDLYAYNSSDHYQSTTDWKGQLDMYTRILGSQPNATTGANHRSDFVMAIIGEIDDPTNNSNATYNAASNQKDSTGLAVGAVGSDTVGYSASNLTAMRFAHGSWALIADTGLNRVFIRTGSSDNSGYNRFRRDPTNWNLDLGAPSEAFTTDSGDTTGAGTTRVYKRAFANYTVYVNPTNASRTGTPGSIAAGGVTFVAAVSAPDVVSVSPTSATNAADRTITLTGTGFVTGAVVSLGSTALATTFVSSTSLTAVVPSGTTTGVYALTVTNPDDQTDTLAAAYTVTAAIAGPGTPVHLPKGPALTARARLHKGRQ